MYFTLLHNITLLKYNNNIADRLIENNLDKGRTERLGAYAKFE